MATEIRRFTAVAVQYWWAVWDDETRSWMNGNYQQAKAQEFADRFNAMPPAATQHLWVPLAEVREMEVVRHGR